jgi:hypothetical protein
MPSVFAGMGGMAARRRIVDQGAWGVRKRPAPGDAPVVGERVFHQDSAYDKALAADDDKPDVEFATRRATRRAGGGRGLARARGGGLPRAAHGAPAVPRRALAADERAKPDFAVDETGGSRNDAPVEFFRIGPAAMDAGTPP